MSAIAWLHISDLHFRESRLYDSTVVTDSLLDDISSRVKIAPELSQIDFVFVTGDIAFSGKTEEYVLAQRFLNELIRITGVSKKQVFLIPGNHDVDRTQISEESRNILSKLGSRHAVNELLENPIDRATIMKRFENYGRFFNEYFGKEPLFDVDHYYYVEKRAVADKSIAVLGLNSAWASSSDQDQLNLFLGERQVRQAIRHPDSLSADVRIVLMHHSFDWLRDFDADNCEPLLLDKGNIVLHGHLHRTSIIHRQTPNRNSILIGAGASYETREHLNSYSLAHIDLHKRTGSLYLRTYSDKDGGFWSADSTSYRAVLGKYNFRFPTEEKAEETVPAYHVVAEPAGSTDQEKNTEKSNLKVKDNRLKESSHPHVAALSKWWNDRGYTGDPFLFDDANDLRGEEAFLDIFQSWYVDPNLPANRNGFGGTPTIDEIMSTETNNLVLIYAPSGGGKTFCRLWATKQAEDSQKGNIVEISNLVGKLPDPEHTSALDLTLCICQTICEKFKIEEPLSQVDHVQHVLTECDTKLKNLSSSQGISARVFVFIDDADQLFNEYDGEKNISALKAISYLCRAVASQSDISLALRLFFPLELKEPLQDLLGVRTRQRIREVTLRWGADHCESVLEARLDSYWHNGPHTYSGRHLERLLHQDALTELRRQLGGDYLSPRGVIRLLWDLCNFAFLHDISVDRTINSGLMVDFMNSRISEICPPVQYPLTFAPLSKSRPRKSKFWQRVGKFFKEGLLQLSAWIRKIINRIAKITDVISAFWILSFLVATILFILWVMIQDVWYGRDVSILNYAKKIWDFIIAHLQ